MCANKLRDEQFISQKLSGDRVEVEVMPRLGANLTSFKVDGDELIHFDKAGLLASEDYTGCFMMFPTPCRLTGSKYTFGGREIRQRKGGEDVFIHGLVRDEEFAVTRENNKLTCTLAIDKNHAVYEGYPFPCTLSVAFSLLERGLQIEFDYRNTGETDAPFGFGMHPFWRIPGERKDVAVQVPCSDTLELVNLMQTGKTDPVEGTDLDLRSFRSLEGLAIDNAFWGRDPTGEQGLTFADRGIKLTLESSEIFEHMIAYVPDGEPFMCLENLTCCPDAPNVYANGAEEVSGLKIVSPGQSLQGWVRFVVTDL